LPAAHAATPLVLEERSFSKILRSHASKIHNANDPVAASHQTRSEIPAQGPMAQPVASTMATHTSGRLGSGSRRHILRALSKSDAAAR